MKKLLLIMLVGMFMLSFASAGTINVDLLQPADNETYHYRDVNFSCFGESSIGLKNASLYANYSGSWSKINETDITLIYDNQQHNQPREGSASTSNRYGVKILVGDESITISNITKYSTDSGTKSYIEDSGNNILSTASYSGDVATHDYHLSANTVYFFTNDANGASYDADQSNDVSFPISSTYLNWTAGYREGIGENQDYLWNVKSAWVEISSNESNVSFINSIPSETDWACQVCDVEDDCGFNDYNFTLKFGSIINNLSYSLQSYETDLQDYILNLTSDVSPSSAYFIFNGTEYSAAVSSVSGNEYEINSTLNIPINQLGSNNLYFKWDENGNTTFTRNETQTINRVLLGQCNSTLTTEYLNYTFKDEVSLDYINSTLITDWVYYLGDGSVNKSFDYTNTSYYYNYSFCFSPDSENVNVKGTTQYKSDGYPQRRYDFTSILSSSITNKVLWLLDAADGIYAQFQIVGTDTSGEGLQGVKVDVDRDIEGSSVDLTSDVSDDSGVAIFFLNPDFVHTFTFIKTGYQTLVQTLQPTSADIYTVTLSAGAGVGGNGWNATDVLDDVFYSVGPRNKFLKNDTDYTFSFCIEANETITATMNITNSTGDNVISSSGSGTNFCLSQSVNTGNSTSMKGYYSIAKGDEVFAFDPLWSVGDFGAGSFSLWAFLAEFGIQNDGGEGSKIISWIMMFIMMGAVGAVGLFFYTRSGSDILDSSIVPLLGVVLVVWIFSLAGWLNVEFFPGSGWMDKHGIASLISIISMGLITWRVTT